MNMNESFKYFILFIASIISATGIVLLIGSIIDLLPKPLLWKSIFGTLFIVVGAMIAVLVRGK